MNASRLINIAIVGVGNCASALVQGISFYSQTNSHAGLLHSSIEGYEVSDIRVVCAFDIDKRKVGVPLRKALFALPNNTKQFWSDAILCGDVVVQMGKSADGIPAHMESFPEHVRFLLSSEKDAVQSDIVETLRRTKVDVLVNYLPVGAEIATKFYMECALEAGVGVVNCIPVFIASDEKWAKEFSRRNLPIVGDDVKSQFGATILHRTITELCARRGAEVLNTYQLNVGGNTDFLNMLDRSRLTQKKISKTEAVTSTFMKDVPSENVHVGPSDYVPWLNDNKICFIRLDGSAFGDIPFNMELRLSVEDSPNSAGVVVDAIRYCKIAKERGLGGPLKGVSASLMKHPPQQMSDVEAENEIALFIRGSH